MRYLSLTLVLGVCSMLLSCQSAQVAPTDLDPPMAEIKPKELEKHGHVRVDNYFWLRERENPEVIDYLTQENEYTEAMTAHTKKLQDELFEEIKGRIKQTDESVPYMLDGYYYYTRYEEGKAYPIYCRKKGSMDGAEEIMIDVNELAEGHEYCAVSGRNVSPDGKLLAFAVDTVSRRLYTMQIKNLDTGELYPEKIDNVSGSSAWASDNKTIFYTKKDVGTLRSFQIYRHVLGTDPAADELIFEETDETFSTFVFKTKSKKYVMIASYQTLSSEYRYLDADNPNGSFTVFAQRQRDHEYDLDHFQDKFYIRTNDKAKNFRLMATPVNRTAKRNWEEIIPHRTDVMFSGFEVFQNHLVLSERKDGLRQIRIMPWDGSGEHYLDFGEPAYLAYVDTNPDINTHILRYGYTSMTTPNSTYDYDMNSREKTLLKQEEVLGGFNSSDYETDRLYATADDGTRIPVSIVYRKGTEKNGQNPLLLYGYGSYGASMDASFSSARLSLLDRGFVYAIAHIRGGEELGRHWYEDGKLFKKKNTFTDFIDCGEFLVEQGYTNSDKMFAMGGSAGGLLVGAVMNMAPELFNAIVARVPWVDVVTTMLDDDIPLTTSEYDEWGDPNKKDYYDYMLSYSPYDNVEAKNYPNLLVTTGLHDSQVQYWEPAKWVAKLRALKTDDNRLLLKTNMSAGHGGASGRFERYRETAFIYSFLLDMVKTSS